MPEARVSDAITLAWEEFGDAGATPLLLIPGLGSQMLSWPEELCDALVAHGLRTIRIDNRDSGLSTHLAGEPDMTAIMGGDRSSALYSIEDMADDAAGLLDALGIERAHVAGVSMGGMIAQALAATHPGRVIGLVSIMSTTGERAVSKPTDAAREALMWPRATTPAEAEQRALDFARVAGSPGLVDEQRVRATARAAFERAHDPTAYSRQLAAIWASGDRTRAVRLIGAPTLVVHGELDPLIPLAAGRATAAAIAGSELLVIEGMGHDLPPPLWPRLSEAIGAHLTRI